MSVKFHSKNIDKVGCSAIAMLALGVSVLAQGPTTPQRPAQKPAARSVSEPAAASSVVEPQAYVIGVEDILTIVYWRDQEMTTEVAVRPDGQISLSLLNDVQAAGLTPTQLRDRITEESKRYLEDPLVTVVVKQINSRK